MTNKTPFSLVADLFKADPAASDDELFERFWKRGQSLLREIARGWFDQTIRQIRRASEQTALVIAQKEAASRTRAHAVSVRAHSFVSQVRTQARQEVKSLLDTIILRDGRALGDVQWYELDVLARENEREATILRAVKAFCRVNDDQTKVRDVVSASAMRSIMDGVKMPA